MRKDIPVEVRARVFQDALTDILSHGVEPWKACVYWTMFGCRHLHRETGILALPQAGSCFWPRYHRGQRDRDYGYGFEEYPHEALRPLGEGSVLPEMHCWLVIPDDPQDPQVIDLATGTLPTAYRKLVMHQYGNRDWDTNLPPPYLWCRASELPADVDYFPHEQAVRYMVLAATTKGIVPACFKDFLRKGLTP